MYKGIMERYRKYLPVNESTPNVTLYEGNTPLLKARNISKALDMDLYFKFEGLNPTGSFKDRGMFLAVAKAMEKGSKAIICASTGNTSASAAAFAAKYNLKCFVIIPSGNIAMGKLAQALMYGAKVIAIDGNFDDALKIVREISEKENISLVNSVNPYRLEGQKTGAFEIIDDIGQIDYLAIPVGNAGNISAYHMGFKEYRSLGKINNLPKLIGVEAEGSSAIYQNKVIENPTTIASAIRIGNPASFEKAVNALKESEGKIESVTDDEILESQKLLSMKEGIFAEPASCASLAGILKLKKLNYFKGNEKIVAILTGNGLKDVDVALKSVNAPVKIKGTKESVLKVIKEEN